MADTVGSLVDKLATVNQKMFLVQEDLYKIRKMSFEEFKTSFATEEGLQKLYNAFKKATDLNVQRQAMILEVDRKMIEIVQKMIDGEDIDNGLTVQNQYKTY